MNLVIFLFKFRQGWQNSGDFSWDWWWGWQVISDGTVTSLISNPADGDLLAFGGDPVSGTLVCVTGFIPNSLLGVGFITSGSVRSRVTFNAKITRLATAFSSSFYVIIYCYFTRNIFFSFFCENYFQII